ncbi:MAG: fused MFS/spermidine synthase [Legionellaceae bacterium]|nr:fused MFS/spermidine synthase [Legionellaceae bacterium]
MISNLERLDIESVQKKHTSRAFIFLLLLTEGFITISLEILSIRQLLPFVGSSVIVTSLIIGVFLLFLSFGYYLGGNCNKKHFEKLQFNFNIAACFAGIGLSYAFCEVFFFMGDHFFTQQRLFSLLIYLLLVLAPVVLLLGQTIPITTNFFKQSDSVNKISSQTLFLSTLGSFLGAVLTSLILLNYLGVGESVLFNALLLLTLSLALAFKIKKHRGTQLFIVMVTASCLYNLNIHHEKQHFNLTNNYANYHVQHETNNHVNTSYLWINNALMSSMDETNKSAEYIEIVKNIVFNELALKEKEILVVGAGGFSFSYENTFNNHFTYIDIDKNIQQITEKYFLRHPIKGTFVAADARIHFNQKTNNYDLIFSDPYSKYNIPSSLLTKEYFESLKQHLNLNGYAVFNIIADPFLRDAYSKRIDNTLSAVFKNCMKQPLKYQSPSNIIYVCQKNINENDAYIYTDNNNRSSMDQFRAIDNA